MERAIARQIRLALVYSTPIAERLPRRHVKRIPPRTTPVWTAEARPDHPRQEVATDAEQPEGPTARLTRQFDPALREGDDRDRIDAFSYRDH